MKKNYVTPSLEITKFETEDVLNASVPGTDTPNSVQTPIEANGETTIRPGTIRP